MRVCSPPFDAAYPQHSQGHCRPSRCTGSAGQWYGSQYAGQPPPGRLGLPSAAWWPAAVCHPGPPQDPGQGASLSEFSPADDLTAASVAAAGADEDRVGEDGTVAGGSECEWLAGDGGGGWHGAENAGQPSGRSEVREIAARGRAASPAWVCSQKGGAPPAPARSRQASAKRAQDRNWRGCIHPASIRVSLRHPSESGIHPSQSESMHSDPWAPGRGARTPARKPAAARSACASRGRCACSCPAPERVPSGSEHRASSARLDAAAAPAGRLQLLRPARQFPGPPLWRPLP